MLNDKPGYWAVLPAQVRYDPTIPPNAKLLYAEISALTDASGYCFATNAYFEQLYDLSERTVSRLISTLESAGYIRIEDKAGGREQRKIYAGINPLQTASDKATGTPRQKCLYPPSDLTTPPDKNVYPNNIKKSINKPPKPPKGGCDWEPDMFERFWAAYPWKKDKVSARREWNRLKPDRKLMDVMSAALARDKASDDWQRGIGIPYACRWISHRRWEDAQECKADAADNVDAPERRLVGDRC